MLKSFLNVGGNSKAIVVPEYFRDWKHDLLDVDPNTGADIICDGCNLMSLQPKIYDAVYCSHNLEHYYAHEVHQVLKGFYHILKDDGFVEIRVPDILFVIKYAVKNNLDLDDILYQSGLGPIMVKDVIYGFGKEIEKSGNSFFAHKTGFSANSITNVFIKSDFAYSYLREINEMFEIKVYSFKKEPSEELKRMLRLETFKVMSNPVQEYP